MFPIRFQETGSFVLLSICDHVQVYTSTYKYIQLPGTLRNQIIGARLENADHLSKEVQGTVYCTDFESAKDTCSKLNLMSLGGRLINTTCVPWPTDSGNKDKETEKIIGLRVSFMIRKRIREEDLDGETEERLELCLRIVVRGRFSPVANLCKSSDLPIHKHSWPVQASTCTFVSFALTCLH